MLAIEMQSLSQRAHGLRPSPTLAITARAKVMQDGGIDVISFGAGEPDFNTPEPICEAAIVALKSGQTKYTASSGTPALKKAIVDNVKRNTGVAIAPKQVVVSCGAKHSMYNAMMTLVNPGDEVILIAPYWMTYADQIILAGGTPVVVQTTVETGFAPTAEQLRAAITERTKAIVVNSPSNPTGAVLTRQTLKEIAALAMRHDFWIVSDEIYDKLVYAEKHESIFGLSEEVRARTLYVNGCSKTYAMTGWRVGYCVAPPEVALAMSNLQDQVTSNPTSFAQAGAIVAMEMDDAAIEAMRAEFEARRDLVLAELSNVPGFNTCVPHGAFYAFPDVSAHLGARFATDVELADFLLDHAHVATVPGSVFSGKGHIRLSYATSRAKIVEGVSRIRNALQNNI